MIPSSNVGLLDERRQDLQAEFPQWLREYEPQLPLDRLVERINELFHSFDAAHYESEHPEIFQALPPLWKEMIAQLPEREEWTVLNIGCGTGFEAAQVVQHIPKGVKQLACFDPSPEMLARCRERLKPVSFATFDTRLEEACSRGPFDLLITNSLLHHLPNLSRTLEAVLPALSPGAWWLAGHEPSARFFRNPHALRFLDEYSRYYRWGKFFRPRVYATKIRILLGRHPLCATARAAVERGWFKKVPSALVIDRLVDFHVLRGPQEISEGRGLDFVQMQERLAADWSLRWVSTYSFFGPFKISDAPRRWVERSQRLAQQFPRDGANFAMVLSRQGTTSGTTRTV